MKNDDNTQQLIASLQKENADLKEQLQQQAFWFDTESSQSQYKELILKYKALEAEVVRLNNENKGLLDIINELQSKRTSSEESILLQAQVKVLEKDKGVLEEQLQNSTSLSEEYKKLLNWGKAMKEHQKGRHPSPKIPNDFIKEKLSTGMSIYAIHKEILKQGIKCTEKAVRDRVRRMKESGEIV